MLKAPKLLILSILGVTSTRLHFQRMNKQTQDQKRKEKMIVDEPSASTALLERTNDETTSCAASPFPPGLGYYPTRSIQDYSTSTTVVALARSPNVRGFMRPVMGPYPASMLLHHPSDPTI
jgi:hypothetical protein